MIFNEESLKKEIIEKWGEFGAHNEVFTAMSQQIKDLKEQLILSGVSGSYSEKQVDEAYDKGFKDALGRI